MLSVWLHLTWSFLYFSRPHWHVSFLWTISKFFQYFVNSKNSIISFSAHGFTPAAHPPLQRSLKWSQLSNFSTDVAVVVFVALQEVVLWIRTQFLSTSHPLYSCCLPIITPAVFPHYSRCLPATSETKKMSITQPFLHGSIAGFFVSWPSRKCGYENIHSSYPASSSPILFLLPTRFTPAVYPPLKKPPK